MRTRFGLLVLMFTLTAGIGPATAQDAPTEKVPVELLGEFSFINDGVVTFYLEGDLILGQVTTVPASDGIKLIGGADIGPCNFTEGNHFPFVLDEFGVGEWFFFDINNAGDCVRFDGSPVTVSFTLIGATATGQVPAGHRDFSEVPNSHAMTRLGTVTNFPTTTVATTTTTTTTTTVPALTDEEALEVLGEDGPSSWDEFFDSIWPFVLPLIILSVLLFVLLWRKGWRVPWYVEPLPEQPDSPAPEKDDPEHQCTCTAELTIEGAHSILKCCKRPTARLNECGDGKGSLDPLRTHLDLNVRGQEALDYFDLIYQAKITPGECEGGGRLRLEDVETRWHLDDHGDKGLGISVEVTIPVDCPHGPAEPLHLFEHRMIEWQEGKCIVGVMIKQVDTLDVSHVETHIICGNYSETFGYFPKGTRSFGNTILGAEGKVGRTRENKPVYHANGRTARLDIRLADNYRGSPEHRAVDWDIWWFTFDDCKTCDKLRDYWEGISADPGTYYLAGKNCAESAAEGLKEVGILPAGFITWTTVTPREIALSLANEYPDITPQEIRRGN